MSSFKNELKGVDSYTRHKKLIHDYLAYYRGTIPTNIPEEYKTEKDIIRDNHKFVRSSADEPETWEQRVAKKYCDTLFKEYAICELRYYKEGKIALRWRVEKEVMSGKGQFVCASTRCEATKPLQSWEVNFGYTENGEKKNELVKVRLCPECSDKLNYKTMKRVAKRQDKKKSKKRRTDQKKSDESGSDSDEESSLASDEEAEKDQKEKVSNIWSKPTESKEEKSKEEEYEDYFADLLQ